MDITHISVSRKSVWEECQQKYKYKYHLKVPNTEPEAPYFLYGKIVHRIAEIYVQSKGKAKIEEIANDVVRGKIPLERKADEVINENQNLLSTIPADYKKKLPEHIKAIKKITTQMGTDGHLEWEFKYDLDAPNGKNMVGFIDRLFQKGDMWYILDYKTTKKGMWRKNASNITEDLQLRAYARIVQKTFDVPAKNIRAALYYLEGCELVGAKFSVASLVAAEQELLKAYNDIVERNPDHAWGNVKDHCKRCEYNKMCPFYSTDRVYAKYMSENS
jgi:hypothetical protein